MLRPPARHLLLALALLLVPSGALRSAEAPSAAELVARARASAGGRSVLVAFHASWCSWCRALERLTRLPATKPVFDRHYEVVWLTVDERPERKQKETPGADALRSELGGAGAALPSYAVLGPDGKAVATSWRKGPDGKVDGIGFPGTPEEVAQFLALFRAGAPGLTADEEGALRSGIASLSRR